MTSCYCCNSGISYRSSCYYKLAIRVDRSVGIGFHKLDTDDPAASSLVGSAVADCSVVVPKAAAAEFDGLNNGV